MKLVIIKLILRYIAGLCCAYTAIQDSVSTFASTEGILAAAVMTLFLVYKFMLHEMHIKPSRKFKVLNCLYWTNILLIPINHHFIESRLLTHIIEGLLSLSVIIMCELLLDCLLES